MPLNPAIAQVVELIAKAKRPPFHTLSASAARASYERSALILDIAPAAMFDKVRVAVTLVLSMSDTTMSVRFSGVSSV